MLTRLEGESFAYSRSMRDQSPRVKEGLRSPGLDLVLEDIQQYLRSIFALVNTIDSDAFSKEELDWHNEHTQESD